MNKKSLSVIASSILASTFIVTNASAQYIEGEDIKETEGLEYKTLSIDSESQPILLEDQTDLQKFLQISGIISEITKEMNGNYYVSVEGEQPFGVYVDEKTLILNNIGEEVTLEEGMQFTAFVNPNKPMILIYPPRYSPEVIIAETEEGTFQQDQFDENYLNKNKDLVLKLDDETPIYNLSGEKLTKTDIIDQNVVVFYKYLTKSYPAQTSPSKVIVLDSTDIEELPINIEDEDKDNQLANGVDMIPLRATAEQLGYKVEFTGKGAIVSKGALSFTITIGEKMYGYNKALREFSEAPSLLEYGKIYVSSEFMQLLEENVE